MQLKNDAGQNAGCEAHTNDLKIGFAFVQDIIDDDAHHPLARLRSHQSTAVPQRVYAALVIALKIFNSFPLVVLSTRSVYLLLTSAI